MDGRDPRRSIRSPAILIGVGVVLWFITWLINRAIYSRKTYVRDVEDLDTDRDFK